MLIILTILINAFKIVYSSLRREIIKSIFGALFDALHIKILFNMFKLHYSRGFRRILMLSLGLFALNIGHASGPLIDSYVEQYKFIAISEMHRTGIPASIKLAQGLLESDFGRSPLANQGNNHFGIKCGSQWTGPEFFKKDDDKDKDGNIIPSCFRAYANAEESYIAHSDFLKDPRKNYRYGFLFDYSSSDYSSWANGLKSAGYATDPKYPHKLIQIIEDNQLYLFDENIYAEPVASTESVETAAHTKSKRSKKLEDLSSNEGVVFLKKVIKEEVSLAKAKHELTKINGSKALILAYKETPMDLAKSRNINLRKFMAFNEFISYPEDSIDVGDIVFLDAKQRDFDGGKSRHVVRQGERMETICQKYGIWLHDLYRKNRLPKGTQPLVGETLVLNGLVKIRKRPKFKREYQVEDEDETLLFDEDLASLR